MGKRLTSPNVCFMIESSRTNVLNAWKMFYRHGYFSLVYISQQSGGRQWSIKLAAQQSCGVLNSRKLFRNPCTVCADAELE